MGEAANVLKRLSVSGGGARGQGKQESGGQAERGREQGGVGAKFFHDERPEEEVRESMSESVASGKGPVWDTEATIQRRGRGGQEGEWGEGGKG